MKSKWKMAAAAAATASSAAILAMLGSAPGTSQPAQVVVVGTCVHQEADVAGCQPGAFDAFAANIPTRRINAQGMLDPMATEEEVRFGARVLEERLGLFRNFDNLHWVMLVPSVQDPATGAWGGGDLDGEGDGRALTISGKCLFAGHANGGGGEHPMEIFRIADNPVQDPPVKVGEIPVPAPGTDDSIMAAHLMTRSDGTEMIIVARDVSTDFGGLYVYEVDPATCAVVNAADFFDWGGDMHEFSVWIDPNNPYRMLIAGAAFGGAGNPDPYRPGMVNPDLRIQALTDENTGQMLQQPITLAHFTLQDVGGPLAAERPDETGLFRDGRFADYREAIGDDGQPLQTRRGQAIAYPTSQSNRAHQSTFSPDGRRIYVPHGTAGFYVLNSEAIAANTNADLAAGNAGCNFDSTNVWVNAVVGGQIDGTRYAEVVNDCLHMRVNDDPGVQALLAAGDYRGYERLLDRSRFDPTPSEYNSTGMHSAVLVPGRPSLANTNTDQSLPAYVIITSERSGCPSSHMWLVNVEVDAFPFVTDSFGVANNDLRNCVEDNIAFEYNGAPRRSLSTQNHNPTVFQNLVFVSWYAHGVRALDISNPYNIREVGHAVPAPHGVARSYPVFSDGLMYWVDNDTGLHVARYTGPRANEIPQTLVWEGNAAAGHR